MLPVFIGIKQRCVKKDVSNFYISVQSVLRKVWETMGAFTSYNMD